MTGLDCLAAMVPPPAPVGYVFGALAIALALAGACVLLERYW